jgi:ring-1,2-phenylacetyl-CoA epoxidase subunit PaaE
MAAPHFHTLNVKRVSPEAAGAMAITLAVPSGLRGAFAFKPGQFLTLRAVVNGESVRRSYSICSSQQQFAKDGEIEVGVKPVANGVFSNWAVKLKAGDVLDVMPPEGRFCPRTVALQPPAAGSFAEPSAQITARPAATHRVAFAAGSGITPVLSIIASTLQAEPASRFTLVYANQKVNTIMFNEALQDLKDRYPARLTLIHVLSRQAQDVPLLGGRLDAAKLAELLHSLLPVQHIDEAFICGPEGMIDATEHALLHAGLAKERIHTERFFSADAPAPSAAQASRASAKNTENPNAMNSIANYSIRTSAKSLFGQKFSLQVVLDGKTHALSMGEQDKVLDVALAAGLDLPYACRGGVCCTCRARVLQGKVEMVKNFTLEQWEMDKGFVLTCQARPLSPEITVSFDER